MNKAEYSTCLGLNRDDWGKLEKRSSEFFPNYFGAILLLLLVIKCKLGVDLDTVSPLLNVMKLHEFLEKDSSPIEESYKESLHEWMEKMYWHVIHEFCCIYKEKIDPDLSISWPSFMLHKGKKQGVSVCFLPIVSKEKENGDLDVNVEEEGGVTLIEMSHLRIDMVA